jgi:hypothetical protein
MPRKSRKKRVRQKARHNPQPVAAKAVDQRRESLPTLARQTRQAPVAKSLVTGAGLADRYRYVLSDARRSLIIGGALILLLIVLSFFLR